VDHERKEMKRLNRIGIEINDAYDSLKQVRSMSFQQSYFVRDDGQIRFPL